MTLSSEDQQLSEIIKAVEVVRENGRILGIDCDGRLFAYPCQNAHDYTRLDIRPIEQAVLGLLSHQKNSTSNNDFFGFSQMVWKIGPLPDNPTKTKDNKQCRWRDINGMLCNNNLFSKDASLQDWNQARVLMHDEKGYLVLMELFKLLIDAVIDGCRYKIEEDWKITLARCFFLVKKYGFAHQAKKHCLEQNILLRAAEHGCFTVLKLVIDEKMYDRKFLDQALYELLLNNHGYDTSVCRKSIAILRDAGADHIAVLDRFKRYDYEYSSFDRAGRFAFNYWLESCTYDPNEWFYKDAHGVERFKLSNNVMTAENAAAVFRHPNRRIPQDHAFDEIEYFKERITSVVSIFDVPGYDAGAMIPYRKDIYDYAVRAYILALEAQKYGNYNALRRYIINKKCEVDGLIESLTTRQAHLLEPSAQATIISRDSLFDKCFVFNIGASEFKKHKLAEFKSYTLLQQRDKRRLGLLMLV
ncbi:MAG: hypothetical protein WC707_00455 [Candidatus Babeliaceae bacterium]|jgi:hypothetical protein